MTNQQPSSDELEQYLGKEVVVDTKSSYLFIGTLVAISPQLLTLANVDVHDQAEVRSSKEIYIMEARKFGIKKNRQQVQMVRGEMIAISLLEDVIVY